MALDLLFVAPELPHPLHGGAALRIRNILEGLSDRGYRIHLVAGAEDNATQAVQAIDESCEEVHAFQREPADRWRWLRSLFSSRPYPAGRFATSAYHRTIQEVCNSEDIDLAWVNFLFMLEPFQMDYPFPVILDQHEVQYDVWQEYLASGKLLERVFAIQNLAKLLRWEPRYLSSADAIASVSPREKEATNHRTGRGIDVWNVPNGVAVEEFEPLPPPHEGTQEIAFVGGMGVKRNADAARWFVEEIFPRVLESEPDTRFSIVGSNPLPEVRACNDKIGVTVTGTVPDVRPYYKDANVVVVPQRFGAGTKLKVLEALALQRPLVTTPNGAQGIGLEDGEHAFVREDPEEFASAIVSLLQDPDRGRNLTKRGRDFVETHYAWSSIVDDLDQRLRRLVEDCGSTVNA